MLIAYRREHISMTVCRTPNSKHEMVAAVGRRVGQRRKVLALSIYVPPSYDASQSKSCMEHICNTITSLKNRYNDPYIFVGGDFNKRELNAAIRDFRDIQIVPTGPTRGNSVLDIIATNLHDKVSEVTTIAPIHSEEGVPSDHRAVLIRTAMPRVPNYDISTYTYYRRDEDSLEAFNEFVGRQSWNEIYEEESLSKKVERFHQIIEDGIKESFEKKTTRKKTSEPSWISVGIRQNLSLIHI